MRAEQVTSTRSLTGQTDSEESVSLVQCLQTAGLGVKTALRTEGPGGMGRAGWNPRPGLQRRSRAGPNPWKCPHSQAALRPRDSGPAPGSGRPRARTPGHSVKGGTTEPHQVSSPSFPATPTVPWFLRSRLSSKQPPRPVCHWVATKG